LERPPEWVLGPLYREFFADRLIVPQLGQGRPIWFIRRAAEDPTRGPKYLSLACQGPLLGLLMARNLAINLPGIDQTGQDVGGSGGTV